MSTPNAQQIEYWNEVSGPKWVAVADTVDAQIAPIGREAIERAQVREGERVLDVGCGCGQTSVALTERSGPAGRVLGVDISAPMLADARRRADQAGASQVSFLQADAQVHAFEAGSFDLVFSRFGVMFFDDPVAAFSNLHGALASSGRLCFVCWQPLSQNAWMRVPAEVAGRYVELPAPSDPHAPGPFAFADPKRVQGILETAGFRDVAVEGLTGDLRIGEGRALDEIVVFLQQMGPAGAALREATEDTRSQAAEGMREALSAHYDGDALVMGFAAWIVSGAA